MALYQVRIYLPLVKGVKNRQFRHYDRFFLTPILQKITLLYQHRHATIYVFVRCHISRQNDKQKILKISLYRCNPEKFIFTQTNAATRRPVLTISPRRTRYPGGGGYEFQLSQKRPGSSSCWPSGMCLPWTVAVSRCRGLPLCSRE